jgi:NACalpha-BTF3-like transcription factor
MDSNIIDAAKKAILESEYRMQQNKQDENSVATEKIDLVSQRIRVLDEKIDKILEKLKD